MGDKIKIPEWLAGPEKCLTCDLPAKLCAYHLTGRDKDVSVEYSYKCAKGHLNTWRDKAHIKSYLEFVSAQVEAGIIKTLGDGMLE